MSTQQDSSNDYKAPTEIRTCKRCGRIDLDKNLEVDEETMQEYMRCALGNRPFSKVFRLADDQIRIKLVSPSNEMERLINRIIKQSDKDAAEGKESDFMPMDARIILELESIEIYNPETCAYDIRWEADDKTRAGFMKNPKDSFNKLADTVDGITLQLVRRAAVTFLILTATITETLVDKDFYKGAGLL